MDARVPVILTLTCLVLGCTTVDEAATDRGMTPQSMCPELDSPGVRDKCYRQEAVGTKNIWFCEQIHAIQTRHLVIRYYGIEIAASQMELLQGVPGVGACRHFIASFSQ